eukprot:431421-Rhodomonas_salina.1
MCKSRPRAQGSSYRQGSDRVEVGVSRVGDDGNADHEAQPLAEADFLGLRKRLVAPHLLVPRDGVLFDSLRVREEMGQRGPAGLQHTRHVSTRLP